ncbi:MAG TPA: TIGR03668 family PPOX class F420-dependent oxidoreductase [Blastocatellia bacterium]|jgi:PPOX class probable F420-dependent enzyme|nr:TIGR03668 family PPOX class F420-dependent oxidoreductase [Blastocatellia bacterium]
MPLDIDDSTRAFIAGHRVARLATADGEGRPFVVPVCYAFDSESVYSPIDEKPKAVAARRLKRVRNIEANPHVSLVIDDYSENWDQLQWVLITGLAEIILPLGGAGEHARAVALLRGKYPQYHSMAIDERMIIKIIPTRVRRWGAR